MKCLEHYITPEKRLEMEERFYLTSLNSHERRVLNYAIMIFTVLAEPFNLGHKKRNLLYYGALLHDIGYEISPQKHDAHTRNLILNDPFFDFWPQPERTMLALIAGGHRKKMGLEINQLSQRNQEIVRQLASILRIADAIDYPRDHHLEICEIGLRDHELELVIRSTACYTVTARVAQKDSLFTEVFGFPITITEI